jgi:GT2 family glycosyltransferase
LTKRLLESIRVHTPQGHELIVVDNASTDGTVDYLKGQPDMKIIFNPKNLGFPKACNRGVKAATGDNILFLNNDTVVTENWLGNMLRLLYSDEKIAMVGPVSNYCSGPQQIAVGYQDLSKLDDFARQNSLLHAGSAMSYPRLSGFCLLVKKSVLDEIGLFDERFGIGNFEDDDLCLRARKKGYELMIALDSFVHHEGHMTFNSIEEADLHHLLEENRKKARDKWGKDIYTLLFESDMTISLCMIVKNEEDTIGRCLESVKDLVDEINIVDTGSTDRTKEIVRQYTDRIFDFEWIDDFAAARNFAFQQATKNYILWLDADDVLLEEDRQKFMKLKEELDPTVDSVTMKYHLAIDASGNVSFSNRRNRLVKRERNFRWHGAVHEYLEVYGNIYNSEIAITHMGENHDSDRNLKIYEKRLARGETFTPRDLFYYANELFDHQLFEKAAEYYLKFLQTKQGWVEDEIAACGKLADIYYHLGDEEKERAFAFKSFEYGPPRAEFCCRIGYQFFKHEDYQTSVFWYRLATQLEKPKDHWGFINEACWTWIPHIQLCVCYWRLGDYEKSYHHNEMARRFNPDDPNVLANKNLLENVLKETKEQEQQ